MLLSLEKRKQTSLSRAHPGEQPCGLHGAVTGLNVSRFIFHSYLGSLLKAQARFSDHHSTSGFLELCPLLSEINLCGEKCTCPVLLGVGR